VAGFNADRPGALTKGCDCFSSLTLMFLTDCGGSLDGGIGLDEAKKLALVGLIAGAPRLILFLVNICR
jgi:hypothetical protein